MVGRPIVCYTPAMASIPGALLYLLVASLKLAGPGSDLQFDYLQDSAFVASLSATANAGEPVGSYLLRSTELDLELQVEQSDLYAHIYYLHQAGEPVRVVSVLGFLRAVSRHGGSADDALLVPASEIAFDAGGDAAGAMESTSGGETSVFRLRRSHYEVLSIPDEGVTLIVRR